MSQTIDVPALRKRYEDLKCMGIVALIDHLEQKRKEGHVILRCGASPFFVFGSMDGSKTPMEQLAELVETAHELGEPEFTNFNLYCADLAETDPTKFRILRIKTEVTRPAQ